MSTAASASKADGIVTRRILKTIGALLVTVSVFLAIVVLRLGSHQAEAKLRANGSGSALPHPLFHSFDSSLEKWGFCSGSSCESCVAETHSFGDCRWCEATKSCHMMGSPLDTCVTALHTEQWLCSSKEYPYQMQSFIASELQSSVQFAASIKHLFVGSDVPFPELPVGQSARYNAATGEMLQSGQPPPAAGRPVRIGIAADWGAGTKESAAVAALLSTFNSDHTVHMGDVYYVGDETDYRTNYFGEAPWGGGIGVAFPPGKLGHWPLVGNHEMLCRGKGFFNYARPRTGPIENGQATGMLSSYAALETEHWRVVMIDDSYGSYPKGIISAALDSLDMMSSCAMPESELAWLRTVLADPSDKRGIILLGHHNYRNAFAPSCQDHVKQLAQVIPRGREIIWLYGHIHSFQMQNLSQPTEDAPIAAWSRCVGNGGFTQEVAELMQPPTHSLDVNQAVDRRVYRTLPITTATGAATREVAFNGYSTLVLDGPKASFEYRTFACDGDCTEGGPSFTQSTLLASEDFIVDSTSGNAKLVAQVLTDELHRLDYKRS